MEIIIGRILQSTQNMEKGQFKETGLGFRVSKAEILSFEANGQLFPFLAKYEFRK